MNAKLPKFVVLIYESRNGWIIRNIGKANAHLFARFLASDSEIQTIKSIVESCGFNVTAIDLSHTSLTDIKRLVNKLTPNAIVWNLSDGYDYFSGSLVPSMSTLLGVPYVGSGTYTQALCQKKHHLKALLNSMGIPTARWVNLSRDETPGYTDVNQLSTPLFVKPAEMDNSIGSEIINPVQTTVKSAINAANELFSAGFDETLIEEYLPGEEITLVGIHLEKWHFLSLRQVYEGSYINSLTKDKGEGCLRRQELIDCPEAEDIAGKLIKSIDLKDYFRIDLRRNHTGILNLIEVNSSTFLTTISFTNASRILFSDRVNMFSQIINHAFLRQTELLTQT